MVHSRYRTSAPSGENRVVDQEIGALEADGHLVERFERHSDDIEHWPVYRRALMPAKVVWNGEARRSLGNLIGQFHPEIVHIHNTFPLISASVLKTCLELRVPVAFTVHNYKLLCATGDLFRQGRVCHDCIGRRLSYPALTHRCYRGSLAATSPIVASMMLNRDAWRRLVSAFVFVSEAQRRICLPLGLPADRTFVKPNLVPVARVRPVAKKHEVAYIGRLDQAKGLPLLMKAWELFERSGRRAGLKLVLVGAGPLDQEVQRWAASKDSVEVLGSLPPSQCASVVARAIAVVVPSESEETFGLVAVEAMAGAAAPIAAAHGSFPELVTPDRDGVLFEPGSAAALARVLEDLDARPDHYERLGRAARLTYLERFDPGKNLRQLLEIYRFASTWPVWRDIDSDEDGLRHGLVT